MANSSKVNFTKFTQCSTTNVSLEDITCIITIIINSISCPFTVLLNVLVVLAVKSRPRLRSNSNILFACLAVTDALTGLIGQPAFILWKIFQLLGDTTSHEVAVFHNIFVTGVIVSSLLILTFATFERLVAIKFTMHYFYVITVRKIKISVTVFWTFPVIYALIYISSTQQGSFLGYIPLFIIVSCLLFISMAYMILYSETCRHQKKIKTQQIPIEEMEIFTKENKALKTTAIVVGALIFSFLPVILFLIFLRVSAFVSLVSIWDPWMRTAAQLNSLCNPLIYCWRQRGIREFVFRPRNRLVHPTE